MRTASDLCMIGAIIALVAAFVWLFSGCASTYQGPPLTFSASYTQDGASFGGSIRLDPSFAKQKK